MRLYDIELEMKVIRSAVASPSRMAVLRRLGGEKLFHYTAAEVIFKRASRIIKRTGEAPKWSELKHDPQIPESIRETMSEVGRPYKKKREFVKSGERLEEFARIRAGLDVVMKISELAKEESVDPDEINMLLAEGAQVTRKNAKDDVFRHFGTKGSRTGKEAFEEMKNAAKDMFLPTGFNSFDKTSRGFIKPSVVVLASQSGGGKTKLAGQLVLNMSLNGARCAIWSLEMDHNELELRHISRLSKIPMSELLYPERLSPKKQKRIIKTYDKYQKILRERGTFASFAVPKGATNIQDLLDQSEPYDYDVIVIDYVSLLEDANEENQWRSLSDAVAYAKTWSTPNKTIVVILAQLKEDETLKLAKNIKDHANNMWTWKFGDKEQETRIIHIKQQKARNQPMYDFYLKDDTDTMTIRDPTDEEMQEYERSLGSSSNRGKASDYDRIKNRKG